MGPDPQEAWALATRRRRAALAGYAAAHRLPIGEAEQRFLVRLGQKFTIRADALAWMADHPVAPSGLDIPARRRERLR